MAAEILLFEGSPGPEIVRSLTEILGRRGIVPFGTEIRGAERRRSPFHVAGGRISYTPGVRRCRARRTLQV
jgi:hypothetical protein